VGGLVSVEWGTGAEDPLWLMLDRDRCYPCVRPGHVQWDSCSAQGVKVIWQEVASREEDPPLAGTLTALLFLVSMILSDQMS
jgi:hypothetical protein